MGGSQRVSLPQRPSTARPSTARKRGASKMVPATVLRSHTPPPETLSVRTNYMSSPQPIRAVGGFKPQHPAVLSTACISYEEEPQQTSPRLNDFCANLMDLEEYEMEELPVQTNYSAMKPSKLRPQSARPVR